MYLIKIYYVLDNEFHGEIVPHEELVFRLIELQAVGAQGIVFEGLSFED